MADALLWVVVGASVVLVLFVVVVGRTRPRDADDEELDADEAEWDEAHADESEEPHPAAVPAASPVGTETPEARTAAGAEAAGASGGPSGLPRNAAGDDPSGEPVQVDRPGASTLAAAAAGTDAGTGAPRDTAPQGREPGVQPAVHERGGYASTATTMPRDARNAPTAEPAPTTGGTDAADDDAAGDGVGGEDSQTAPQAAATRAAATEVVKSRKEEHRRPTSPPRGRAGMAVLTLLVLLLLLGSVGLGYAVLDLRDDLEHAQGDLDRRVDQAEQRLGARTDRILERVPDFRAIRRDLDVLATELFGSTDGEGRTGALRRLRQDLDATVQLIEEFPSADCVNDAFTRLASFSLELSRYVLRADSKNPLPLPTFTTPRCS